MRTFVRNTTPLFFTVALAMSLFTAGCTVHAGVYDAYHSDYHRWDDHEVVYYNRWEHDTHRDHVDFKKRNQADQKAYWQWRHDQH